MAQVIAMSIKQLLLNLILGLSLDSVSGVPIVDLIPSACISFSGNERSLRCAHKIPQDCITGTNSCLCFE